MRKYLLILLGSIVAILCWAKPDFIYRYWFDADQATMVEGHATGDGVQVEADVSGLSEQLHVLHVQIFDGTEAPGAISSRLFVKSPLNDGTDHLRYWFDNKIEAARTVSGAGAIDVDVSGLAEGLHTISIQTTGSEPSPVRSSIFLKMLQRDGADHLRYWFDCNIETARTASASGVMDIDVSNLAEGLHTISIQTIGSEPSPVRSSMFIKAPQMIGTEYVTCVTYVDGALYKSEKVDPGNGVLHYDMPIAELSEGLHTLSVQLVTPQGGATDLKSCYFLRHITANELSRMRCFYSVDGFSGQSEASVFDNGDFSFDVDVSSVKDGLHSITYMLTLDDGSVSDIKTALFYKIPLGGYGVMRYSYWLNDRDEDIKYVDVEGLPSQLNLTELLPVESQPFRSSLFHFEIDNSGEPWTYAANEFHFRVFSNDLRSTEMSKVYTDYSVAKKVENVKDLVSGVPAVGDKPLENEIQWYNFHAIYGDSLSFKVDRACTVQVFSPTGKKVYEASGSEVVNWGGFHAKEDGNFYLALHDVTAQQGYNTTLEYQHIDKYAVLDHTPDKLGRAHSVLIADLWGNGFDKLVSAKLVSGEYEVPIDTIVTQSISKSKLFVELAKTDIPLGKYNLSLSFNDGESEDKLLVSDFIEIEEPIYGDIELKVEPHNTTQVPYPITVKIRNTGNVPYQLIPVNIANTGGDRISDITFNNFCLSTDCDKEGETNAAGYLTNRVFLTDTVGYYLPMIIDHLEAYQEVELEFGYNAPRNYSFDFYAWAQEPWVVTSGKAFAPHAAKAPSGDAPCCNIDLTGVADNVPTFNPVDMADNVSNMGQALGMVFGGIVNTSRANTNRAVLDAYGITPDLIGNDLYNDIYSSRPMYGGVHSPQQIINTALGQGGLRVPRKVIAFASGRSVGCNCPNPDPIYIPAPVDPNDIIGYSAPSGSTFVKKDFVNLNYKIEFENDTAFATSSAHVVVVTDTLDTKLFDLASYRPTHVVIGEKNVPLNGRPNFVKTIDMRPQINTIAQVEGTLDMQKGIVKWTFTSLDPMTMEPTYGIMSGFLPINYDGRGQGEVLFDINLKADLPDGTEIPNRASIVFDKEEPIMTPVWVNVIDAVAPTSKIVSVDLTDKETARVTFTGQDERSGIWRYNLYVQYGVDAPWEPLVENIDTTTVNIKIYEGIDHGFCVQAVDLAGNVEDKPLHREATLGNYLLGDANSDGVVDIQDAVLIVQYFIEAPETYLNGPAADFNKDGLVDMQDAVGIVDKYVSTDSHRQSIRKRLIIK